MKTGNILLWGLLIILFAVTGFFVYREFLAPEPEPAPQETVVSNLAQDVNGTEAVSAEGVVAPQREVLLGFSQPGKISEVLVEEGQPVEAGETLIVLEQDALEAALRQAEAALQTARVNRQAAETSLEQIRNSAHQAEAAARITGWEGDLPDEIDQPNWYFTRTEEISSTRMEVEAARRAIEIELEDLEMVLQRASSADLLAAERRLSDAQTAFLVADQVLERAQNAGDDELETRAQQTYDAALSELQAAQDSHDQALDTQGAERVLEARAQAAVAQERYDTAIDRLNELLTGDDSLEVRRAQDELERSAAAETEAEAAVDAARTSLADTTLEAPFSGVIARLDAEPGQSVSPGVQLVTLADQENWVIRTTDLVENDVALLTIGMPAVVTLDAFPGRTFEGTLEQIALWSEDSRGSVTYETVINFIPGNVPVRWGMTAFVEIEVSD